MPEEDKGRAGSGVESGGLSASPIVQFRSKEGCFLWPSCWLDVDPSAVRVVLGVSVPISVPEFCREWCKSRTDAAEGRFSGVGLGLSWLLLDRPGDCLTVSLRESCCCERRVFCRDVGLSVKVGILGNIVAGAIVDASLRLRFRPASSELISLP